MDFDEKQLENALLAAQMYYYQNLPMKRIAIELEVSHSTVSRLLTWARNQGLVEIRINDLRGRSSPLEEVIKLHYAIKDVRVVPVSETAGESVWQNRVAKAAANYLNNMMESGMMLGVAWGQTVSQIAANLTPKPLINAHVIQLNGGEKVSRLGNFTATELIARIANNYEACAHLFSVPPFFDYQETKQALWRESSIQQILSLQRQADILLFSVGSYLEGPHSSVYTDSYLQPQDYEEIERAAVVGDIANIMIRADGSYHDIAINDRACGPDLSHFHEVDRSICVVTRHEKLAGLRGALAGGYITDLIIDEPTARKLVDAITNTTKEAS